MSTATTSSSTSTHLLTTNQGVDRGSKTKPDPQPKNLDPEDAEASDVDSPATPEPDLDLGPQFSLKEQIELHKDDASLRKWKEQLLGSLDVVGGEGSVKEAEVRVVRQSIHSPGRPDIVRRTPYEASSPKSPLFTLKEGCLQQAAFHFVVSNNIVCGLKYVCDVWKKGIKVSSTKKMVGTFAPRGEPYKFDLEESKIPCGFFVRGTYQCRLRFVDDDGKTHFDATYYFEIQKTWGSSG